MLIRLLITVLMLVGPNHFCTCTASDEHLVPCFQTISISDASPLVKHGCDCHSESHLDSLDSGNESSNHSPTNPPGSDPDSPNHPHHPDCPVVISPMAVSAISFRSIDSPTDCDVVLLGRTTTFGCELARFADQLESSHCFHAPPLYILFLTLLI